MTKSRAAFNYSHLPVVELRGVSLNRGSRRILSDLHLQLMPGERLAIVGPSGAGKTTILRMLAGLELPTAGELRLFGEPQRYLRLDQSHPPDVRLVSQSPALLASLSVLQNVGFLLYRDGSLGEAEIKRRVARCLDAVGLAGTAQGAPVAETRCYVDGFETPVRCVSISVPLDLHQAMKALLPSALFIGFTGTPLFKI